jgi:hypothetical protein
MGSWQVTALACVLGGLSASVPLAAQSRPSVAGEWQIELTVPTTGTSAARTARGVLQLSDTLSAGRNGVGLSSPTPAFVGTYHIDFRPLRASPIGNRIRGEVSAGSHFRALLGEGYDRGEIELHGNIAADSVSGQLLIVDGENRTRSGTFTMRRQRR